MIYHQALPLQQDVQPGTPKPLPLLRQLPETLAQNIVITRLWLVPIARRRDIDQQTGSSFTQPKAFPNVRNR